MIDLQTRDPAAGGGWNSGPSRSAGLYGELPVPPPRIPAESPAVAASRKPRRELQPAD